MAFRRRVRRNLILLLIFTFISVGLFFALLQTSRDVVKNRNVFQSGSTFITTSNLTTNEAPLEIKTSSVNDLTERMLQHKVKSRQVLLVVAHGRSGSTFLADIFDKHPRVFFRVTGEQYFRLHFGSPCLYLQNGGELNARL